MSEQPITLSDERLEILRLVENQTVTAEEANRLLEALDRSDASAAFTGDTMPIPPLPPDAPAAPRAPGGSVRIKITDLKTNKAQINLVLPYRLVDSGVKLAKKLAPEYLLDSREIRRSIEEGYWGPLLDVTDNDKRVEITVEGDSSGNGSVAISRGNRRLRQDRIERDES